MPEYIEKIETVEDAVSELNRLRNRHVGALMRYLTETIGQVAPIAEAAIKEEFSRFRRDVESRIIRGE